MNTMTGQRVVFNRRAISRMGPMVKIEVEIPRLEAQNAAITSGLHLNNCGLSHNQSTQNETISVGRK